MITVLDRVGREREGDGIVRTGRKNGFAGLSGFPPYASGPWWRTSVPFTMKITSSQIFVA